MGLLSDIVKKIRKITMLTHSPYQAEKYLDNKAGKDIVPGLYSPEEMRRTIPLGAPPSLVQLNDPKVRAAKVTAMRNAIRNSTRRRTMLTSIGGRESATAERKTLLGS